MSDGHDVYIKPGETKVETQTVQDTQSQSFKSGVSKKKIFSYLFVAVASVATWHNILVPGIQFFWPEYSNVTEQLSPEISDLLEASKKNCQVGAFNRRGCKAIWAGVHVPPLTADGR